MQQEADSISRIGDKQLGILFLGYRAQSVKKAANRQNGSFDCLGFFLVPQLLKTVGLYLLPHRKRLLRKHFDLLRKPDSNVPMYADESGLLVFAAPLTSVSLSKNMFFDRLSSASRFGGCRAIFYRLDMGLVRSWISCRSEIMELDTKKPSGVRCQRPS